MKYSIDGIVKVTHEKAREPAQVQKQVSMMKKININIKHFLHKRKMWFMVGGIVIVLIGAMGTGYIVVKKRSVITENENGISVENDSVNYSENDIGPQELNVFHIVIDTEEFHVDTDIIEGRTDDDLHRGVVHQDGSAFPSRYGGNVVITGHRWYPDDGEFSKVFQNMDKLKEKDEIIIKYKDKTYTYSVDSWTIVETEDTKFLEHTSESHLTIYTCHPKFTSERRLVYTAVLDSVENVK